MSLLTLLAVAASKLSVQVVKPSITSPTANEQDVSINATLQSSAFQTTGGADTHLSSDWEIATDPDFTNIVASSYDDTTNLTSWKP